MKMQILFFLVAAVILISELGCAMPTAQSLIPESNTEHATINELTQNEGFLVRLKRDKAGCIGGAAGGGAGGGAAIGAASGAAIGSVVPGIGTIIGGVIGAIAGAVGGGSLGGAAGAVGC